MNKKSKVIKLLNKDELNEVCRCCLSKDTPIYNIFDLSHDHIPFVDIFSQLLVTYVNSNDDMPRKICDTCLTQVLRFYNFKSNFHKAKTILSTIISKNSEKSVQIQISKENDINPKIDSIERITVHESLKEEENLELNPENEENYDDITIKEETLEDIKDILPENSSTSEPEGELHTVIRPFYCKYCDRAFTKNGYSKHCKAYECNICEIIFTEQCSLQTHQFIHSDKKPHLCEYCGSSFISGIKLKIHQVKHTGESPYMCELCGAKYKSRHGLYLHKITKHKEKYSSKNLRRFKEKRFKCELCGVNLCTKQSLQKHMKSIHTEKNLSCTECNTKFISPLRYVNHFEKLHGEGMPNKLDKNTEQHKCEKCNKVYTKIEILSNHVLAHHTKNKTRHKCVVCHKTFSRIECLKVHMNMHSGETTAYHFCQDCPKKFLHKTSLDLHRRIHSGENIFECHICGKKFLAKHHYKGHLRSHAGEKPYKCSHCEKSYSHSYVLTQHMKIHTGEDFYSCVQCPKKFSILSLYKKHKELEHSNG